MSRLDVFIIPHWHFDALWQLSFKEYFDITAENLVDLLEFLEKDDRYRFNIDQTIYIEEFLKEFPELSGELKKFVEKGFIEFVCSGYTQPDSNIPQGEFIVRNIILFQTFVKKMFGREAKCGWFLDVYGQSAQLPQIFKKAKIDYFVFWRGVSKRIPSEFLWEGIDGTRILTHRMPLSYGAGYIPEGKRRYYFFIKTTTIDDAITFLKDLIEKLREIASTNIIFIPNGDDFTPPQRFIVKVVEEMRRREGDNLDINIATASQFFKKLEKHLEKLPIIRGEFNPIFRGTYSTRIELKKFNRRVEYLYLIAEEMATIASLFKKSFPKEELENALKLVLTNQFHDAINGEIIDEVYDIVLKNYESAENICRKILEKSLQIIVDKIDTSTEFNGIPVVVVNPLSWNRTDMVEVTVAFTDPEIKGLKVVDWKGNNIPFQIIDVNKNPDGSLGIVKLIFTAENMPSLGYRVYYILPSSKKSLESFETSIKVSEIESDYIMENRYYSIKLDHLSKSIVSIYDKELGKNVLDSSKYLGNSIFIEPDYGSVCHINGDIDPHLVAIPIRDPPDLNSRLNTMKCVSRCIFVEKGPIRAVAYIFGVVGNTKYRQRIIIYDKVQRIDFNTELEFGDENHRVRVVFPINISKYKIWHEIPYGAIERNEGEYPAINWIDVSNKDYGVTLINKGIPGNSVVENVMILTLLRSIDAMYLDAPFGELRLRKIGKMFLEKAGKHYIFYPLGSKALEKGYHLFEYSLYPHIKTWREAKSYRTALEFNIPLIAVKTTPHKGFLPKEKSFISLVPENLVLTVLKRCEDNGVILRFYEAEGKSVKGYLTFFKEVKNAVKTNLLEEKVSDLKIDRGNIIVNVKPFEIVTVKLMV